MSMDKAYIGIIHIGVVPMWIVCKRLVRVCRKLVRVCRKPENKPLKIKENLRWLSLIPFKNVKDILRGRTASSSKGGQSPLFPLGKRDFLPRGVFLAGGVK